MDPWVPDWRVEPSHVMVGVLQRKGGGVQAFLNTPSRTTRTSHRDPRLRLPFAMSVRSQDIHGDHVSTASVIPPGKVCGHLYLYFNLWKPCHVPQN